MAQPSLHRISDLLILFAIVHCTEKESKDTLADESSEELKRLQSKGDDVHDNNDDAEKQGSASSATAVETESEVTMNKSNLTKSSEVLVVHDIHAK